MTVDLPVQILSPKPGGKGSDTCLPVQANNNTSNPVVATPPTGSAGPVPSSKRGIRCSRWCGWNPQTRLFLFFTFYIVFLCPVLVALVREFSRESKGDSLLIPLMHPGGPEFLFALSQWLLVLLVVYFAYRTLGRKLGIKLHDKTLAKHKDDLLRLVYFGMTMAAVGGIAKRIEEGVVNHETGLTFIPLTLCYCIFFTIIFELVKERDITLSVGLMDNKIGLFVVCLGFVTGLLVVSVLFVTAWEVGPNFFAMYLGVTLVGLLAHVIMFFPWVPGVQGRSYLHLHHWYWSVPLAHMCVFHTDVSMLAQAIFLAIHIHGVDCFGVEPLFYDTERRARHPSDFDWILKEHAHASRPYDAYLPEEGFVRNNNNDKPGPVVDSIVYKRISHVVEGEVEEEAESLIRANELA